MSNCSFCLGNLICPDHPPVFPDHPPVFPDDSYSLGFKEGVMWAKAVAMCKKDAEWGEDYSEWCHGPAHVYLRLRVRPRNGSKEGPVKIELEAAQHMLYALARITMNHHKPNCPVGVGFVTGKTCTCMNVWAREALEKVNPMTSAPSTDPAIDRLIAFRIMGWSDWSGEFSDGKPLYGVPAREFCPTRDMNDAMLVAGMLGSRFQSVHRNPNGYWVASGSIASAQEVRSNEQSSPERAICDLAVMLIGMDPLPDLRAHELLHQLETAVTWMYGHHNEEGQRACRERCQQLIDDFNRFRGGK